MTTYRKVRGILCSILKTVCAALLLAMVLLAVLQVVTRYFISVTVIWVEELSIYLMGWLCALGIGWVWMEKGGHIKMDVLEHVLPASIIRWMDVVIDSVVAVLGCLVIRVGIKTYTVNKGYSMSTMGLKECDRFLPIIVGGVLLSLCALIMLVEHIHQIRTGGEEYDS